MQKTSLDAVRVISTVLVCCLVIGCGAREAVYPESTDAATAESGSIFNVFSGNDARQNNGTPNEGTPTKPRGLSVNADLWRATLDTLSFLPLASADPTSGVVISDWYNDPKIADERFKITVIISGLDLRADALRVTLMREKKQGARWSTMAANKIVARQLENIILTRARDFRIARGSARR